MSNPELRRQLGWDEDEYWQVRNRLVDEGLIQKGRGQGGSVSLVIEDVTATVSAPESHDSHQLITHEGAGVVSSPGRVAERELYEPIERVLKERWSKDARLGDFWVEDTSQQGRRATGGTWSRPDFTVLSMRAYVHLPGRYFDVTTFEVKPFDQLDVTAVYEALAHRRAATRSYVLAFIPDSERERLEETVDAIVDEAKKHGIGVIVASEASNYDKWDTTVDAKRVEPEPERMNTFIAKQVSEPGKERLNLWFK